MPARSGRFASACASRRMSVNSAHATFAPQPGSRCGRRGAMRFPSGSFHATDGDHLGHSCSPVAVTRRTPVRFRPVGMRGACRGRHPRCVGPDAFAARRVAILGGCAARKTVRPEHFHVEYQRGRRDDAAAALCGLRPLSRDGRPEPRHPLSRPVLPVDGRGARRERAARAELAREPVRRLRPRAPFGRRYPAPERPRQHQRGTGDETGGRLRDLEGVSARAARGYPAQHRRLERLGRRFLRVHAAAGQQRAFLLVRGADRVVRRFALHEQLVRREPGSRRAFGAAGVFVGGRDQVVRCGRDHGLVREQALVHHDRRRDRAARRPRRAQPDHATVDQRRVRHVGELPVLSTAGQQGGDRGSGISRHI
ncbi:hypothetical protein BCEP4_180034 [Burkholderia cepacia]|nr:hypothetical protein BCEP4_180034 [Burkholderia cepacia]